MSKRKSPRQEPAPWGWVQLHKDIETVLGVMPYEFSMEAVIEGLESLGWDRKSLPSPQWLGGKFRAVTPGFTKSWTRHWTLDMATFYESFEETSMRRAKERKAWEIRRSQTILPLS